MCVNQIHVVASDIKNKAKFVGLFINNPRKFNDHDKHKCKKTYAANFFPFSIQILMLIQIIKFYATSNSYVLFNVCFFNLVRFSTFTWKGLLHVLTRLFEFYFLTLYGCQIFTFLLSYFYYFRVSIILQKFWK